MANTWPAKRRIVGTRVPRVDGPDKSTGHAKYSFDINRPGMLHAVMLRSPYARATIEALDTTAAEKMPGVKAIHIVRNVKGELYFAGDEILAIAADTEEQARDARRAVKIKYKPLDHLVLEQDVLKNPKKVTVGGGRESNVGKSSEFSRGNVAEGSKQAHAVVTGTYGVPTICHQCLESHGLVAEWDSEQKNLTVWCSTQAVAGTANGLAQYFKLPPAQVKCITQNMGGGYGSKFAADIQGNVAAELARKAKAPVKLMLDREEEATVGGNRPSAFGTVKIAGNKDGSLVAYEVDCYGTPGESGAATVNFGLLPYVYVEVPNVNRKHAPLFTNCGRARAMRAPGHPQNCVLTEWPIDDLAAKLGIDPLVIRLKNLPPNDSKAAAANPAAFLGQRETIYQKEIDIAVKESGWKEKWHQPGKGPSKGPWKHGLGMSLHTWGGFAGGENEVKVAIAKDGSVTVETSTQDLGTGQRTVNAIVAAEVFGLDPKEVVLKLSESQYGPSSGSGGSTTCPAQAPATLLACEAARADFFTKIAPKLKADPKDLAIEPGKVVDTKNKKDIPWKQACSMLGMDSARGVGNWSGARATDPKNAGQRLSSGQVGGVQTAEVWVDTETGVVRCTHMVAVQDCGMIVNLQGCESQVAGGVIMGVNYALFEERIMDRVTGRQVNPDMEFYKLGGIEDMPKITVRMVDMPERGVIGIGEPPTISTCAAVGNAVFNALGVRVPMAPFSPRNVLAALAKS